jgi:hypothetical protein
MKILSDELLLSKPRLPHAKILLPPYENFRIFNGPDSGCRSRKKEA